MAAKEGEGWRSDGRGDDGKVLHELVSGAEGVKTASHVHSV